MSSIEKVIGPSINRLSDKNSSVKQALIQGYKDNKRNVEVIKKKKQACIVEDVRYIIEATPDSLFTKAEEASLWLFAL